MFRPIKLREKNDFNLDLYSNRRSRPIEVPVDYVKSIEYNINDCDVLTLEIPSKIMHNGQAIDNKVFFNTRGKRCFVAMGKEKYIVTKIRVVEGKDIKIKHVTALSFESDLSRKDLPLPTGITRQLYRKPDEKVEIADGILNLLEQQTKWKIGYVDIDAMKDTGMFDETVDLDLYSNLTINNVKRETLLFDKILDINIGEKELKLNIAYGDIKCTDKDNNVIKEGEKQLHLIDKLNSGVKRIKAIYGVNDKFEEVIKYEFTLLDGFVMKREEKFTFLDNMHVTFKSIYLTYFTGNKVEQQVTKYRYFEQGKRQWLPFLRQDVSSAYDCTFIFDTVNKIVNCYANKNIGNEDNGLYLSYDNYIKEIEKTEDSKDVVSRLYVEGQNGLTFNSVNPLGTDYVEDFTYIKNQDNMSYELEQALDRYYKLADNIKIEWDKLSHDRDVKKQREIFLESKLLELQEKKKVQEHLRIAYMKQEPKTDEINKKLAEIKAELDKLDGEIAKIMQEMATIKDQLKDLDDKISVLNSNLNREKATDSSGLIFTEEDLEELDECIYSDKHQDDFYTTKDGLFENGKKIIKERNTPKIEFSTDIRGITNHPRGWKNVIKLGQKGIIDDKDIIASTEDGKVRIVSFKYIPPRKNKKDSVQNITFTNKEYIEKSKSPISDMAKKTDYTKTMTDFWKQNWKNTTKTNDFVREIREQGLDTASSVIRSRYGINQIDISESGLYCIDRTDGGTDNQVYVGCGMFCITDNGWRTCKTAIDKNGIIGNHIIGNIFVGEKLVISSDKGTFTINGDGMVIYDDMARVRVKLGVFDDGGGVKAGLTLYDKTGRSVVLDENGIIQTTQFPFWDNVSNGGPMEFPIYCDEGVYSNKKILLNLKMQKFRAFEMGVSGGGGVVETVTSSDGGGFSTTSTSTSGGSTSTSGSGTTSSNIVEGSLLIDSVRTTDVLLAGGSSSQVPEVPPHKHGVAIFLNGHKHDTNSHNHSIGNHSHNVTVSQNPHRHNFGVNIPTHTHGIRYGIFEENSYPSNVQVIINNRVVASGINTDTQVDITNYIELNTTNVIKITSSTNGRISGSCYLKQFVGY